jgi:hypothetical protein
MKAQEGENKVNIAGQNLLPLDEIRMSRLISKVNGPHEQWVLKYSAALQVVKPSRLTSLTGGQNV